MSQYLEPACGRAELFAADMRVTADGREIGVAEVLGDEASVSELLAEPGRGCVAECAGGDVLLAGLTAHLRDG